MEQHDRRASRRQGPTGNLNANNQQKGVDSLIRCDLESLASNRAIGDAVVIGGDEDLVSAVEAAQGTGRVHCGASSRDGPTRRSRCCGRSTNQWDLRPRTPSGKPYVTRRPGSPPTSRKGPAPGREGCGRLRRGADRWGVALRAGAGGAGPHLLPGHSLSARAGRPGPAHRGGSRSLQHPSRWARGFAAGAAGRGSGSTSSPSTDVGWLPGGGRPPVSRSSPRPLGGDGCRFSAGRRWRSRGSPRPLGAGWGLSGRAGWAVCAVPRAPGGLVLLGAGSGSPLGARGTARSATHGPRVNVSGVGESGNASRGWLMVGWGRGELREWLRTVRAWACQGCGEPREWAARAARGRSGARGTARGPGLITGAGSGGLRGGPEVGQG